MEMESNYQQQRNEQIKQMEMSLKEKKITHVTVRDGSLQELDISQIVKRLENLAFNTHNPLSKDLINIDLVMKKVISGMYNNVSTCFLDNLAAETCAYMNLVHPQYSQLAAKISISNLHKETKGNFFDTITDLYNYVDLERPAKLIADDVYDVIKKNQYKIQEVINYDRDFNYDFFGFKTLEKSYLLKINKKIVERPQDLLMRVSIGIHKQDIESAFITYELMSQQWFTHATPTLFNAGTPKAQMSSCFLLQMQEDSIEGIYETLKQTAQISKNAGGIGIAMHKIRASGAYITGTNGVSNGLVPMLKVFNETARYVDQGGGKRKGSFAIYLEPWHADIIDFLQLRKNRGKEEYRARDLFYGLWIPDLFMQRVQEDGDWTLMCPNECKGLAEVWGDEFKQLYTKYESEKKGRKTIKARELWEEVINAQIETGTPYLLYKDACNKKSNQKHLGTIQSSNLCTEIVEYTAKDEIAVCNLASVSLAKFVRNEEEIQYNQEDIDFEKYYDFNKLVTVIRQMTYNLNKVIDENWYPLPETSNSNFRHRPIGLGVQGLADALMKMKLPYDSQNAIKLNQMIFEHIYYAACVESLELAKKDGKYESFEGSPISKGILQFDMWDHKPSNKFNWDGLKEEIKKFGLRNSLLVAPMPTASTSQILGNNESFEPYTTNLYTRRVLSGDFVCINKHLVNQLLDLGLWNEKVKNQLIAYNGSVQQINELPQYLKDIYKTTWEISQKALIDHAAARGPFIDQSQSLNLYIAQPQYNKITSMHFYGWQKGLKTGMYYLRSRPAADPIKFTLDVELLLKEGGQIKIDKKAEEITKQIQPDEEQPVDKPQDSQFFCESCSG